MCCGLKLKKQLMVEWIFFVKDASTTARLQRYWFFIIWPCRRRWNNNSRFYYCNYNSSSACEVLFSCIIFPIFILINSICFHFFAEFLERGANRCTSLCEILYLWIGPQISRCKVGICSVKNDVSGWKEWILIY